jgi:hypothetical protein
VRFDTLHQWEERMTERLETATVGNIVAADSRAAAVFEQLGIDFCCGGRQTLGDACRAARVEPQSAVVSLRALALTDRSAEDDVTTWTVERLIDHTSGPRCRRSGATSRSSKTSIARAIRSWST